MENALKCLCCLQEQQEDLNQLREELATQAKLSELFKQRVEEHKALLEKAQKAQSRQLCLLSVVDAPRAGRGRSPEGPC